MTTDWSRHRDDAGTVRDCRECKHSDKWAPYPADTFRVCRHPQVIAVLGGPRSCRDIVRHPDGPCRPEARRFERKA